MRSGRIRGDSRNFGKFSGIQWGFAWHFMEFSGNSWEFSGHGFSGKFGVWGGIGRFGASKGFCANSHASLTTAKTRLLGCRRLGHPQNGKPWLKTTIVGEKCQNLLYFPKYFSVPKIEMQSQRNRRVFKFQSAKSQVLLQVSQRNRQKIAEKNRRARKVSQRPSAENDRNISTFSKSRHFQKAKFPMRSPKI